MILTARTKAYDVGLKYPTTGVFEWDQPYLLGLLSQVIVFTSSGKRNSERDFLNIHPHSLGESRSSALHRHWTDFLLAPFGNVLPLFDFKTKVSGTVIPAEFQGLVSVAHKKLKFSFDSNLVPFVDAGELNIWHIKRQCSPCFPYALFNMNIAWKTFQSLTHVWTQRNAGS